MLVLRQDSPNAGQADYAEAVKRWQFFLIGQGFSEPVVNGARRALVADGDFGSITRQASIDFQQAHNLFPDGVVGNDTLGKAMQLGLQVIADETPATQVEGNPNWPPRPTNLALPSSARRDAFLGKLEFVAAPRPNNPEAIRITNGWDSANITRVTIPQLIGVEGAPGDGRVQFHVKVADELVRLFQAWEAAGLTDRLLTWAGSWVPRFIRGSTTELSNHAYGAAFDINVPWNPLGRRPALVGDRGCVRELVQIANQLGFYWGGHYSTRPDGMHFEFVRY